MALTAYTEKRPRCALCPIPAFGAFTATFATTVDGKKATRDEMVFLCAECAFSRAASVWSGGWSKKLKALQLEAIFKLPPEKAPLPPRKPLPLEDDFVTSKYDVTFCIEGDHFKGDLGEFPTEWAALERARQLAHLTAKSMHQRNFWCVEHGISRRNGVHP
jgi:hypothetical protein